MQTVSEAFAPSARAASRVKGRAPHPGPYSYKGSTLSFLLLNCLLIIPAALKFSPLF